MSYQDFSQVSETLIVQLKNFFINAKTARVAFCLSMLVLILTIFSLISLYLSYKSWVNVDVTILHNPVVLPGQRLSAINKKHLFGQIIKPGATLADARKTTLPLKLKGVINDINPKLGAAIILGPDGVEKSYHVGDKLAIKGYNITLEYIFKNKVFIKNDDALEFIDYPKLELNSGSKRDTDRLPNPQFLPPIPIDRIENTDPINTEIIDDDSENNNRNKKVEDLENESVVDKLSRAHSTRLNLEKFRKKSKMHFN